MKRRYLLQFYLLVFTLLFSISSCFAGAPEIGKQQAVITAVAARLSAETSLAEIAAMREQVRKVAATARNRVKHLESELNRLSTALGEVEAATAKAGNGLAQSGGSQDSGLNIQWKKTEAEVADYKLLLLSCHDLLTRLDEARKKRLALNLSYRADSIHTIGKRLVADDLSNWRQLFSWPKEKRATAELAELRPHIFIVLPAAVLLTLILLCRWPGFSSLLTTTAGKDNLFYHLDRFLLKRNLLFPSAIGVLSAWVLLSRFCPAVSLVAVCICQGGIFLSFLTIIPLCVQALLCRIVAAFSSDLGVDTRRRRLFRFLFSLLLALLILFFSPIVTLLLSPDLLHLGRFVLLVLVLGFIVVSARGLRRRYPQSHLCRLFSLLSVCGGIVFPLLEGMGWHNLVTYLLGGLGATLVLIGLTVAANDMIDLLLDIFRRSRDDIFNFLVRQDRDEDEELLTLAPHKESGMVRFAFKLLLCLSFFYLLSFIWGGAATEPNQFARIFTEGVAFGGLLISPARVVVAFVLFLLGSSAIYYLKRIFDKFWLARSQISKNSRETVLTLCGYLAYAILLLVTLQTAGFRLTGLSMILGAFSVGIGFGLQNVVNNFISGLILMFEQPIKKGNWVKVGGEEGYVKKISIRSTVIQTFDRSDVIVPNSELISSQVTNMMLNDIRGRIKVPVGVAYGTETRLVERLLLEVAADNENVISPPHRLQPRVYFVEFGESSLNFILTCYLHDVNKGVSVRSALNFEIDRVFREHEIEMPFPRRDITIRK